MKHAEGNPEKKYNILGTNAIMDKMKVCLCDHLDVNSLLFWLKVSLEIVRTQKLLPFKRART